MIVASNQRLLTCVLISCAVTIDLFLVLSNSVRDIEDLCGIIIPWDISNINQNLDNLRAQASTRVSAHEIFTQPMAI